MTHLYSVEHANPQLNEKQIKEHKKKTKKNGKQFYKIIWNQKKKCEFNRNSQREKWIARVKFNVIIIYYRKFYNGWRKKEKKKEKIKNK